MKPIIKNGRTLLLIRAVVETMGGSVNWNPGTKALTIEYKGTTIVLTIGSNKGLVNGTPVPIDSQNPNVVPEIINGRTMVPLRFVQNRWVAKWVGTTKQKLLPLPTPLNKQNNEFHLGEGLSSSPFCHRFTDSRLCQIELAHALRSFEYGKHRCQELVRHAYNTSKSAVLGLTIGMAASLGKYGITVNALGPGLFESEMTENTLFKSEAFLQMYNATCPMSRPGLKGELNGPILFFSSDAVSYVTGQFLIVDGGTALV